MQLAIPVQQRPVRNVPIAGFNCAKIMPKPAVHVARFSARPAVSYIVRSTRSPRTGIVENEKQLKTSRTADHPLIRTTAAQQPQNPLHFTALDALD